MWELDLIRSTKYVKDKLSEQGKIEKFYLL